LKYNWYYSSWKKLTSKQCEKRKEWQNQSIQKSTISIIMIIFIMNFFGIAIIMIILIIIIIGNIIFVMIAISFMIIKNASTTMISIIFSWFNLLIIYIILLISMKNIAHYHSSNYFCYNDCYYQNNYFRYNFYFKSVPDNDNWINVNNRDKRIWLLTNWKNALNDNDINCMY